MKLSATDRSSVPRWAWRTYLVVGLLVVLGYYLIPAGIWRDAVYLAVGGSSVAAICAGVRLHRPERRMPWYLMALGQFIWVCGDTIGSWYQDVVHVLPYPSLADACYLAAYPVLGCALVLLIRGRRSSHDLAGLLDSVIVTVGLGVPSWVILARPTVMESGQSSAAVLVGLAYPVADILLVGLLVRLVTTPGGRTPTFRLLLSAVGLLVLGDTISELASLISSQSSPFDFIWLTSYVLWGAAALHPSMQTLSDAAPASVLAFTRRRLAALTIATLTAPVTLAVQLVLGTRIDGWAIVIGSVVLFLLVVARMNLAIDQIVTADQQRERLQQDLTYQATHDSLTRLPNRGYALQLIAGALNRSRRSGAIVGLLFVDLDAFKGINDAFGHRAGDEVLREVARRMTEQIRVGDFVARLGGDEFVVLLEPVESEPSGIDVAQRVVAAICAPISSVVAGRPVSVGASIGAVFNLDGATDAERLLSEADAACYRAKSRGRGRVEVFDDTLRRELHDRAEMEAAMATGLSAGEFVVHYQPVIDVSTEQLDGFEALVRWDRPGIGLVAPDDFIPLAETSTLISEIDRWVLDVALRQRARWGQLAGVRELSMAVNISGRHISDPRVIDDVTAALRDSGVAAGSLILEITETTLIDDLRAIEHLEILRGMGVLISIDDFGTAYNTILQLQHLPVDGIKIDRSFLASTHPGAESLIVLIIQAARAFGLSVVAEGVETIERLAALRAVGCDAAQGYLIGHPQPAAQAEQFLVTRRPRLVAESAQSA